MHDEPRRTIDDLKERQRNLTWPEALENSRGVDELLWKGDPKAPLVQRIGIGLFGFAFALTAVFVFYAIFAREWEPASLLAIIVASAFLFAGLKMLWNAFRRKRKSA
jgi:hypothetical protein